MKVDLDALERRSRLVTADPDENSILAVTPYEALALIARIRELESALGNAFGLVRAGGWHDYADVFLSILEKGAVLP